MPSQKPTVSQRRLWIRQRREGKVSPYAPPIVQQYPAIFLEEYEQAFKDGYEGEPPRSMSPYYIEWYNEGLQICELMRFLDRTLH